MRVAEIVGVITEYWSRAGSPTYEQVYYIVEPDIPHSMPLFRIFGGELIDFPISCIFTDGSRFFIFYSADGGCPHFCGTEYHGYKGKKRLKEISAPEEWILLRIHYAMIEYTKGLK